MKLNLNKAWWNNVLQEVARRIRLRVQKKNKNATGKSFDNYSDQYKKYKGNDFRRFTDGKRLKQFKGQSIQSNKTGTPDMTATGKTMAELQALNITDSGGFVGWLTQGGIVKKLAKVKNFTIVDVGKKNPVPLEYKFFKSALSKEMKKQLKKNSKKKTIVVKL